MISKISEELEKELEKIRETQKFYVDQLIERINDEKNHFKEIDFVSPTGTGKTIMRGMLIDNFPQHFFIVTSLSRGGLHNQIKNKLKEIVKNKNFEVFGTSEYTKNTKKQEPEFIKILPKDKKIIWLRDEGHIKTNNWTKMFENKVDKIVNFSATIENLAAIRCNFTDTMMLRTPKQDYGFPENAINKLLEVKRNHKSVKNYNPCLLVRSFDDETINKFISECKKKNLSI